jgi:hypothetical protein
MSAPSFVAALAARGFRISGTQVVDISRVCPGFAISAVFGRNREIDRAATLARAVAARQEQVAARARVQLELSEPV